MRSKISFGFKLNFPCQGEKLPVRVVWDRTNLETLGEKGGKPALSEQRVRDASRDGGGCRDQSPESGWG